MRHNVRLSIIAGVLLATVCGGGCAAMLKPSEETRRESCSRYQNAFAGDAGRALMQTYFIIAVGPEGDVKLTDPKKMTFVVDTAGGDQVGQALAVGIEEDGYLLTAGHVLGERNFVFGWFDGRPDVKPARVVFRTREEVLHADVAVLKVEGRIRQPARFGPIPAPGDPVFATICFSGENPIGGTLKLAGGKLRDVKHAAADHVDLVNSTIPFWQGDSGGPTFASDGSLIGITTGYTFHPLGWRYERFAFHVDEDFIRDIVARDRQNNGGGRSARSGM